MIQIDNTAAALANQIHDGQSLCLAPDYSGCAMSVTLEIIKQKRKHLTLIGAPQLGLQGDLLIGAGCVSQIDAAAVTLGEYGQAPKFVNAVQNGSVTMRDSTCPVIHAGLQAAEKGIPFMPIRGILGSDLEKHRSDWKTMPNPFSLSESDDPILLVPAIKPDIALFHAPKADRDGNVWIGVRRELMLMAHAAITTLVSVEAIVDECLLDNPETAAGTIPSLYIGGLSVVPGGAKPVGLFGCYEPDHAFLEYYAKAARSDTTFDDCLQKLING